uniref:Uncharacterized protein n=1 Tax=Micrurus carvalhoi TaxID=3147026 RepID=A0A2H6NHJ5_9SAUR
MIALCICCFSEKDTCFRKLKNRCYNAFLQVPKHFVSKPEVIWPYKIPVLNRLKSDLLIQLQDWNAYHWNEFKIFKEMTQQLIEIAFVSKMLFPKSNWTSLFFSLKAFCF